MSRTGTCPYEHTCAIKEHQTTAGGIATHCPFVQSRDGTRCCTVEPMRYDIDPDVINHPARGAAASISYEPDYLLPHAEHKLEILNHSPKGTRRPKILIIDDDE